MNVSRNAGAALLTAFATLLLYGCATLRLLTYRPARLERCPGALLPSELVAGDFRSRMQIQISAQDVDTGYELVMQKRETQLILIGLTRFGARAFSVVQEGTRLQVESAFGAATVVPPENVMRDVHRALLLSAGPAVASGAVEGERDGETIHDTWSDGVLTRRVLSSRDGNVEIDFATPQRMLIHNRRCGYEATLVELETRGGEPLP
jgi:hypothetical protein